jgi:putative aldouronate transport system permease protein
MKMNTQLKRNIPLHVMLLPGVIVVILFRYLPMFGIVIAFKDFSVVRGFSGSEWVGLENFIYLASMPDFLQVLWNTFFIAAMKVIAHLIFPIILALLLNEVTQKFLKRSVQTITYLPYFLSWVMLGGILRDILAIDGIVNQLVTALSMKPVFFLGDNDVFPYVLIVTDLWKNLGWNTIIFLAAITAVNPNLYEAAAIDGANRWRQTTHVTLPGMLPIIILVSALSLGSILEAGFEQVLMLYSAMVYESGDIIDTFTYRMGLQNAQYDIGAAVGFFKSFISLTLISLSYYLAGKYANYRIF